MAKRSFLIFALVALTFGSAVAALGQQAKHGLQDDLPGGRRR